MKKSLTDQVNSLFLQDSIKELVEDHSPEEILEELCARLMHQNENDIRAKFIQNCANQIKQLKAREQFLAMHPER